MSTAFLLPKGSPLWHIYKRKLNIHSGVDNGKMKVEKQSYFLYLEEKHHENYAHIFTWPSALTNFKSSKVSCEDQGESKMLVF